MKTIQLNPKQKKWALTATLLVALGFNLSAPLKEGGNFELASTSPEVKKANVNSPDGKEEWKVEFQERGDKTIAVIEGIACDTGGDCLSSQVLDLPIKSDMEELEKALLAKMKNASSRPSRDEDDEEDDEDQELSKEEKIAEISKAKLGRILDDCERREEGRARATCLTDKFISALKGKRPKIEPEEALLFFESEIRPQLVSVMTAQDTDSFDFAASTSSLFRSSRRTTVSSVRGAELLRKLQAGIPREYSEIRKSAKDAAVEVVNHYSAQARDAANQQTQMQQQARSLGQQADQLMQQAQMTQDPQQRMLIQNQAFRVRTQQQNLVNQAMNMNQEVAKSTSQLENFLVKGLGQQQHAGLQEAIQNRLVDRSFANTLMTSFTVDAGNALINPTFDNQFGTDLASNDPFNITVPQIGQQLPRANGSGSITGGALSPMANQQINTIRQQQQQDLMYQRQSNGFRQ